jgi:hypothetical protein
MHFFYKCCSKECNKYTDIHAIAKNTIATKMDRDGAAPRNDPSKGEKGKVRLPPCIP